MKAWKMTKLRTETSHYTVHIVRVSLSLYITLKVTQNLKLAYVSVRPAHAHALCTEANGCMRSGR